MSGSAGNRRSAGPVAAEQLSDDALWPIADALRGSGRMPSACQVLREAMSRGYRPHWRYLGQLDRLDPSSPEHEDPVIVAEFVVALASGGSPRRVLDSWAGFGVTMAALVEANLVSQGTAIEINRDVLEVARDLSDDSRIDWILGNASKVLTDMTSRYDLVIGSPPIGLPPSEINVSDPPVRLRSSGTYVMLLQAGLTLRPDGLMAVVLPEGFFQPQFQPVRAALEAASLHVSASFALPARTYRATGIPMAVVVFGREPRENLFAAQLESSADFAAVVANFRARRAGRLPQLGQLVDLAEFRSWRSLIRDSDIREAARRTGLRPVPLAETLIAVNRPRSTGEPFDDLGNCVYLPKLGHSPAVTSLDQLIIKPQNYMQLVCDPAVCDADYVAGFFDSTAGRQVREQLMTGTTIPSISLSNIGAGQVLLPPSIRQQQATVTVARELRDLERGVVALTTQLWDQPLAASRIQGDLAKLKGGGGFEQWAESLPFPLASILRRYIAADEPERKCRHLVNFFEGTVVFLVDLLHSGLQQDPSILDETVRHEARDAITYSRGTIGVWSNLLARLAKHTRELAQDSPDTATELFRVTDLERLRSVASKGVVRSLKVDAVEFRNKWVGHTGVVGLAKWARLLSEAEETLAGFRDSLGTAFIGWTLTRPGPGRRRAGVVSTSIEDLTGSHREFRRTTVDLRELPDDGGLYMLEAGASLLLKLGPLFRLRHGPESVEDACYFYNRVVDGKVEWISYHYEVEDEVVTPDEETVTLIRELDLLG